ncbi:I78 family peptidase inhibitor [Sphingomonas sp. KR3-1]|uniref:I78 family peptidase inhibitor n=1 Tax=Sphingomonas sp. KR3-1 TaxID=3156611 RepID=UPI0032B54AFA
MIRLAIPAAAALLTLGACAPKAPPEPIPGVECNASKLGGLVGKTRSPETEAEALRLSRARTSRWLGPDSAATMDFRPDRLNVILDAEGKIISARCG